LLFRIPARQPHLVQAVFKGDVDEVEELLSNGSPEEVNYQDAERRSVLHAAAFCGFHQVAALLISRGARVNAKDNKWVTPLHRACSVGYEKTVEVLLRHEADVNARDKFWQTPLHVAAANNAVSCAELIIPLQNNNGVSSHRDNALMHFLFCSLVPTALCQMVELLLQNKATCNFFDKRDRRAIHWAAYMGHTEVIALLVSHGAEVNVRDKDLYTPLHAAAANGRLSALRQLLSLGAEVDAPNASGNTPLHVACLNGKEDIADELLVAGAHSSALNCRGQTPLHYAAVSTHGAGCLEVLIRKGAGVNQQSDDGRSPLHMTAIHGRFTRAQTLLEHGARVDATDHAGCTALHVAARHGHDLLVGSLLLVGASCDLHSSSGMTPLHMAALGGFTECCRKLIQSGAKLTSRDNKGRTAVHYAAFGGNPETLELLIDSGADYTSCDSYGRLPLHYSVGGPQQGCLSRLLYLGGAEVDRPDSEGLTALQLAASSQDPEGRSLAALLSQGATPCLRDHRGFGPLHCLAAAGHPMSLGAVMLLTMTVLKCFARRTRWCERGWSGFPALPCQALGGHWSCLEALLSKGCLEVDATEEHGWSPLALSALRGHSQCVRLLLQHGARTLVRNPRTGSTALHVAAALGQKECLEILISSANETSAVDVTDNSSKTPLMLAVLKGHVNCVELLLKSGASVDLADESKRTALFCAAFSGNERCAHLLLKAGADILARDVLGKTPLHIAAAVGNAVVLASLLKQCSDGDGCDALFDAQGFTPLHWACQGGHDSCVNRLLKHSRTNKFYGNSFSPLHCAAFAASLAGWMLLLGQGVLLLLQVLHVPVSALHAAAYDDSVLCLQMLLKEGADANTADYRSQTPLMMASRRGSCKTIEALLEHKVDFLVQDQNGNTALHHACLEAKAAVATILEKADFVKLINMINVHMKTALHVAASNGLIDATQALLLKGADVLALDMNGHTPALSCARSNEVAECLALILAVMPPSS
ncbi:ankyrin repeat containing protein, partial [Ixodes scapularis]